MPTLGRFMNQLPVELVSPINLHILRSVADRSAHSDIVYPLQEATRHLPGVNVYTPDGRSFGYLIVYTEHVIFALADGMQGPTLRLPAHLAAEQIALGAVPRSDYGAGWVMFPLFEQTNFPLTALVRAAYEHVRCQAG